MLKALLKGFKLPCSPLLCPQLKEGPRYHLIPWAQSLLARCWVSREEEIPDLGKEDIFSQNSMIPPIEEVHTVSSLGWQATGSQWELLNSAVAHCAKVATGRVQTNGHGWVPRRLYVWTLKFKCHVIFTC